MKYSAALALAIAVSHSCAQPWFTGVGVVPGTGGLPSGASGISSDGLTIVGSGGASQIQSRAFAWTQATGTQSLGSMQGGANGISHAQAVNADGSVIVGYGVSALGGEAFRWTAAGGMQGIGQLPNPGFGGSAAWGVNGSGDTVVGYSWSSPGRQAFRWTESSGMVGLGDLPGGDFDSWAFGVSDDGNTIIGSGHSFSGEQPFMWTPGDGMQILPGFGSKTGAAVAINGAGTIIVGVGASGPGLEAFRWEGGKPTFLGDLPGGDHWSVARDLSEDGSVIVGNGATATSFQQAFYWTESLGMLDLKEYLVSLGTLGLGGWTLTTAQGVSADGLTICGTGINPQGLSEGWVAHVPSPGALSLLCVAAIPIARRRRS